ncbi:YpmS family protein [Metabacillus rhizolycopersici]|uniref:YpmS family protein n=1 Tax=Metabacillus rhizolycopersici TaxID=2875709 RepID=A0ABS7V015_9BACI|nr:YpmS family protein [Metabacillus rhizolycopersici]MBZ5753907.1 YpmS family protein [Metabacillus rhizolycopersici]
MKKWKCLFFSLLLINVVFLIIGTVLALQPSKEREYSILQKEWKESESLSIFVKKEDINVLINKYLQTKINDLPLNLEVRLTDKVEVYGTIQAFGNELDISMNFRPEVQENGDILLKQESMSVGKMDFPVRPFLKYVNNKFSLPQWLQINAKEEFVYVALHEIEINRDFRVKLKKFNLEKNNIQLTFDTTCCST